MRAMDAFFEDLAAILSRHLALDREQAAIWIEKPRRPELGDYAFPCFRLAKTLKQPPVAIASRLADELGPVIEETGSFEPPRAIGPYLNFTMKPERLAAYVVQATLEGTHGYGALPSRDETVVIDFSSPNIARPLSIGHLRSTVIGNCLEQLFHHVGYRVVSINYLGDWGTQFGKLLTAYHRWFEGGLEQITVPVLFQLYVRYHQEVEEHPELEDEARAAFKVLEAGDEESLKLWRLFREVSLKGMAPLYELLGVQFKDISGESFYNLAAEQMIDRLIQNNLAEESDGALIIRTGEKNLGPFQLRKSDGSTLYSTRDLAALTDRVEKYDPVKILYVVGSEQRDHFRKLFNVARQFGVPESVELRHVPFGLYRLGKLKISTRAGRVLFMEDVLVKAVELARGLIEEKNPSLKTKDRVAHAVGVGAIIFADLVNDREKNIDFDWEAILNFDGETGPYIQYAHARTCGVLKKGGQRLEIDEQGSASSFDPAATGLLTSEEEQALLRALHAFPESIVNAVSNCRPSCIAQNLITVARMFSRFYHNCPVIQASGEQRAARLMLTRAVKNVLQGGLKLLGIEAPTSM